MHRLSSFVHCEMLQSAHAGGSITAVLVCCRDNDVHPNPHGYRIGGHQEEETVVCLHTEGQTGPRRLGGTVRNGMSYNKWKPSWPVWRLVPSSWFSMWFSAHTTFTKQCLVEIYQLSKLSQVVPTQISKDWTYIWCFSCQLDHLKCFTFTAWWPWPRKCCCTAITFLWKVNYVVLLQLWDLL